jgi:hypothetical protein
MTPTNRAILLGYLKGLRSDLNEVQRKIGNAERYIADPSEEDAAREEAWKIYAELGFFPTDLSL